MEKLQLTLLEIEPIFFLYVLSATKSIAEGHLTKLKALYKVTSLSKCMFLKALCLGKGISGTQSLWEKIPGCLCHMHALSFPKRISGSAEVVWGGSLFCFPTGCGKSFKRTWTETQLFYWSNSASLQQTAERLGRYEGMYHGHYQSDNILFFSSHCLLHHSLLSWPQIEFSVFALSLLSSPGSFGFRGTLSLLSQLPALGCLFLIFSALPVILH